MPSHKRHAKNAAALRVAGALTKLLVLLIAVIANKGLSVSENGAFNFAFGLGFIFALFTEIGIRGYLLRELARRRDNPEQASEIFGDIFNTRVLLTLAATPFILIAAWVVAGSQHIVAITLWFTLYAFIDSVSMMLKFALRAYERMELDAIFSIIGRLFVLLPVAWFWNEGALTLNRIIVSHLSGAAIDCLCLLTLFKILLPVRYFNPWNIARIKTILVKSFPFAVINLIGLLYLRTALIALGNLHGEESCALFGAAERLPEAALFLPTAIVNALIPTLARAKNDPSLVERVFSLLFRLILMAGLYFGTVFILCPDTILLIISTPEYLSAAPALILCGVWMIGSFTQYVTANVLTCLDEEKWVMRRYTWMCVFNIIVTVALTPKWGVTGAAAALALTQTVASSIDIVRLRGLRCRVGSLDLLIAFGTVLFVGLPILLVPEIPLRIGHLDPQLTAKLPPMAAGLALGAVYCAAISVWKDRHTLKKIFRNN